VLKNTSFQNGLPAGNPIANIFVVIVGALAIGASIVLGFFAFVLVGSLVLIMAAIIGVRIWWFKRKMQRQAGPAQPSGGNKTAGVIEGEFSVVAEDDKDE
jgi:predicted lipid-binding transport protein (Tim44 family)